MKRETIVILAVVALAIFVAGCAKTYSQIEKDTGIRFEEIPKNETVKAVMEK